MDNHQQFLALCRQFNSILLSEEETQVTIAVAPNPSSQLFEALHFICDKQISVEYWSAERLEKAKHLPPSTQNDDGLENGPSIVTLLDDMLQKAIEMRASDIHVEPGENHCRIRFRIDGVLQLQPILPLALAASITARLKVLGNLDIAERRLPQDGQMDVDTGKAKASFRISTLPVRHGEKIVLRLLQQTQQPLELTALGMSHSNIERFQAVLAMPQGMILVTGPTGSGKTITLYSALSLLNTLDTNVCSVEDPVEIPLPGLNQTQVNTKAGLTFQDVLRALLRQDPDVIMVGEIRDSITAEIAVKAAQTGHLVLSTLHTNSSVEAVVRLEQMGVARWMLASALQIVIAQRLVRRLCPHCKQQVKEQLCLPDNLSCSGMIDWLSIGCERCYGGFYGRVALFEILPVDTSIRSAIINGAHAKDIETLARQSGMVTLFESGCQAVNQGLTTFEEVYRVLGVPHG